MIGLVGEVVEVNEKGYYVHCHGETWSATSASKLVVGQRVEVIELSDLILKVIPIKE